MPANAIQNALEPEVSEMSDAALAADISMAISSKRSADAFTAPASDLEPLLREIALQLGRIAERLDQVTHRGAILIQKRGF